MCLMLLVLVAGVLVDAGRGAKGRYGYGGARYGRPVAHRGYSRGCCGGGGRRGGLYKSTVVVQYAKTYRHQQGKCCH